DFLPPKGTTEPEAPPPEPAPPRPEPEPEAPRPESEPVDVPVPVAVASRREPEKRVVSSGDGPSQPLPWKKAAIWSSILVLVGALGGALSIVLTVQHFSSDLPDVHELEKGYAPPQVTRILARDGTLLANVFTERRT